MATGEGISRLFVLVETVLELDIVVKVRPPRSALIAIDRTSEQQLLEKLIPSMTARTNTLLSGTCWQRVFLR